MTKLIPSLAFALTATTGFAEDTRQLDAHEHGVGQLDIAIEGNQIAMEFHAPGADIVGFEYEAKSEEDKAKIAAGIEALESPLALFVLPADAGCSVTHAHAELEGEGDHDDHEEHDHDKEAHDDHDHDAHGHDDHDDHGHIEDGHDDHDHEEHAHDEEHDAHDHDEHAHEEENHTEFHAEYELSCDDATKATSITFAYFDAFPNALEVEVQVVTDKGAQAFEVERDAPTLDLGAVF